MSKNLEILKKLKSFDWNDGTDRWETKKNMIPLLEDFEKRLKIVEAELGIYTDEEIKEISLEEYLLKCAYWGMKTLDDIYFMSLPTKPLEVIEFEQLSYYKRQRLTQEFFADHSGITRYYDQKKWIEIMNETSVYKLKSIKKYLPESDIENHKNLDERITDFKIKMGGYEE